MPEPARREASSAGRGVQRGVFSTLGGLIVASELSAIFPMLAADTAFGAAAAAVAGSLAGVGKVARDRANRKPDDILSQLFGAIFGNLF